MKEQMNVIVDVLENTRQEWACSFHVKKHIGEHSYDIDIEEQSAGAVGEAAGDC